MPPTNCPNIPTCTAPAAFPAPAKPSSPNYILVYRILSDAIEILAILHTRQLYP